MEVCSTSPAKKVSRISSKKIIFGVVAPLAVVAGISFASVEAGHVAPSIHKLNARNGGPSIPPDKPSDSKSIFEIFKGLVS